MQKDDLCKMLEQYGQQQLLQFWDELSEPERCQLSSQISAIDFANLSELIKEYVLKKPETEIPASLEPAPFYPLNATDDTMIELYEQATSQGKDLLKAGKVGCITVAGGQGTRLGFDGPKGTYPIGPISGKSLFGYFAEGIKRNSEKYGIEIPWFIMTSVINNEQTTKFFAENNYFGLNKDKVFFFVQGTMPAVGYDGKLLLESKSSLALSPDGHGGTIWALNVSGALAKMQEWGIEYLSYFQVDNPLVSVVDPKFIGLHAIKNARMSAISLSKTNAFEKLGNFCLVDGKVNIIEYSDLPDELAQSCNADGSLRFVAGSPAIHVISRSFVEELCQGGKPRLPWHRADKKVGYVDASGSKIKPEEPNAVKLESFIFDAMPLADITVILEADRQEAFGPTKNATGVDSAESCREMLVERDMKRLKLAGVDVSGVEMVEIAPAIACDAEDVATYCNKVKLEKLSSLGDGKVYIG